MYPKGLETLIQISKERNMDELLEYLFQMKNIIAVDENLLIQGKSRQQICLQKDYDHHWKIPSTRKCDASFVNRVLKAIIGIKIK